MADKPVVQLEASLKDLFVQYRKHIPVLPAVLKEIVEQTSEQDILLIRTMLRELDYLLKTLYENDDKRMLFTCHVICKVFDTDMEALKHKDKKNNKPVARQMLTYYLVKIKIPRLRIVELLQYGDHSSIIYNLKRISDLVEMKDPETLQWIRIINTEMLRNAGWQHT